MFSLDMADVKPSIPSFLIVTMMAIIGIVFAKWLMTRFPVPGLSEVIQSV